MMESLSCCNARTATAEGWQLIEAAAYIMGMAGFWLRAAPFVVLVFLSFPFSRMRWGRRGVAACCAVIVAASLVVPAFSQHTLGSGFEAIAFAVIAALQLALVRDKFVRKATALFLGGASLTLQVMILLAFDLAKYLEGATGTEDLVVSLAVPVDLPGLALLVAFDALFVPAAAMFARRVLRPYLGAVSQRVMWLEIVALACVLLATCFICFFAVGVAAALPSPVAAALTFTFIFAISYAVLVFFLFRISLAHALEAENRAQMDLLRANANRLQREVEQSRDANHDLRQIVRQVQAFAKEDADLAPYVERIVELTGSTGAVYCENPCLNALFRYYDAYANERGVDLKVSAVCGSIPLRDADLTVLVANVLENATVASVEAAAAAVASGQPCAEKPVIDVVAGVVGGNFALQVANPCSDVRFAPDTPKDLRKGFLPASAFVSTHEGGGRGMRRIDDVVDAYQGRASFSFDDAHGRFITRITLPCEGMGS